MKYLALTLFLMMLIPACSKDEISDNDLTSGVWQFSSFDNDTQVYIRTSGFINEHCYKFNSDGTLVERKNSGFCGTPPVIYDNYPGTWTRNEEGVIRVNVQFWGGETTYDLEIVSLDKSTLRVNVLPVN